MQSSLGGFDLFMKGLIVLSGDLPARLLHSVGVNIFKSKLNLLFMNALWWLKPLEVTIVCF